MRVKRKLGKAAPSKGESDPANLPEYVHIILDEDDGGCECAVCAEEGPDGVCETPKKYIPGIIKDIKRQKAGTVVGLYRLASKHKVDVVLVDVDKKGNKTRR